MPPTSGCASCSRKPSSACLNEDGRSRRTGRRRAKLPSHAGLSGTPRSARRSGPACWGRRSRHGWGRPRILIRLLCGSTYATRTKTVSAREHAGEVDTGGVIGLGRCPRTDAAAPMPEPFGGIDLYGHTGIAVAARPYDRPALPDIAELYPRWQLEPFGIARSDPGKACHARCVRHRGKRGVQGRGAGQCAGRSRETTSRQ